MTSKNKQLNVAMLTIPEITASTLFGMHDLFSSAGRDWNFLVNGTPGEPRFKSQVVAAEKKVVEVSNQVLIHPQLDLEECPAPDIICIPEVFVAPEDNLNGRYDREIKWLRQCYEQGSTLATACSGAVILAETGLLDGYEATTHWGYSDALANRFPDIQLHPERALVVSGEEQRIVMAGGGTSWQDLALFLIARFLGIEEAMRLARIYLVDWHDMGQQPYSSLIRAKQVEDAVISQCQLWIAQNYEKDSPVNAMVELSGLAERSFKRRFAKATGLSPMEYVHTLRLEEAKQMLESGSDSIEYIAHEIGYGDASFFGRLFRRKVGITPAQYRKRFRGLRQALENPVH